MYNYKYLIGNKYRYLLEKPLETYNIDVIWLPDNPFIDKRLSGHADLSAFYLENEIYLAPYLQKYFDDYSFRRLFEKCNRIYFIDEKQYPEYPHDAQLNIRLLQKKAFVNTKTASKIIINRMPDHNIEIIPVNQGYCACSILPCGTDALMTADPGIYAAALNSGMDALKISSGHITLDGFNYGFIGGCGIIDNNSNILFTGEIAEHPDYMKIITFLKKHNIGYSCLTELSLFDIGGAVMIRN